MRSVIVEVAIADESPDPTIEQGDIVVLTGGGVFAEVVINALVARFGHLSVVQEEPEPLADIFKRWVKLRGWPRAIGQMAFGPFQKLAALRAKVRRREILLQAALDATPNTSVARFHVPNVNSEACRDALTDLEPRVVVVVGTRMIRRATLTCIDVPFINYHAGLNPGYRGQYGGYWALASGDPEHAGVTVHLIDEGVDTGALLYAAKFQPTVRDTVAIYHYLQVVAAVPLIIRAVGDALACRLVPQKADGPSKQWFHPTVAQYLANGLRRGVW